MQWLSYLPASILPVKYSRRCRVSRGTETVPLAIRPYPITRMIACWLRKAITSGVRHAAWDLRPGRGSPSLDVPYDTVQAPI